MTNQIVSEVIVGPNTVYTADPDYVPIRIELLKGIKLNDLSTGVEVLPYDDIQNNHFTLGGLRISLKKECANRVVIGCFEYPDYHIAIDQEVFKLTCYEFIYDFLSRIYHRLAA